MGRMNLPMMIRCVRASPISWCGGLLVLNEGLNPVTGLAIYSQGKERLFYQGRLKGLSLLSLLKQRLRVHGH